MDLSNFTELKLVTDGNCVFASDEKNVYKFEIITLISSDGIKHKEIRLKKLEDTK